MSSGEESLSSSLGSDAEGHFFPLHLRRQKLCQHLHAWCHHVPHRLHHPLSSNRSNLLIDSFFLKMRSGGESQLAAEQSRLFQVDLVDF